MALPFTPRTVLIAGTICNATLLVSSAPLILIISLFGCVAFAAPPVGPGALEVRVWMILMWLMPASLLTGTALAWYFSATGKNHPMYISIFVPLFHSLIVAACPIIVLSGQAMHTFSRISSPTTVADFDWLGRRHDRECNFNESVKDYTNEIRVSAPFSYERMSGYLGRAHAYVMLEDYSLAIADYKKYIVLLPESKAPGDLLSESNVMRTMARTYCRWNNYDEALSLCKNLEAHAKTRNELLLMLRLRADVYKEMGNTELAARDKKSIDNVNRILTEYPSWKERWACEQHSGSQKRFLLSNYELYK